MTGQIKTNTTFNQLLWADHATDFGAAPADANNSLITGTNTNIQMDLTSLAAAGGSRGSAKSATLDVSASRAMEYMVDACLEHAATPVDGETVDFYWAPSPASGAGVGNPGSLSGVDAAFTETDGKLAQMQYIGTLTLEADVINIGRVGSFIPKHAFGILVIENNSAAAMHTVMDESHVVATPLAYHDV